MIDPAPKSLHNFIEITVERVYFLKIVFDCSEKIEAAISVVDNGIAIIDDFVIGIGAVLPNLNISFGEIALSPTAGHCSCQFLVKRNACDRTITQSHTISL